MEIEIIVILEVLTWINSTDEFSRRYMKSFIIFEQLCFNLAFWSSFLSNIVSLRLLQQVSDEGDVLYVFPKDYRAKLATKSLRIKIEPWLDKAKVPILSFHVPAFSRETLLVCAQLEICLVTGCCWVSSESFFWDSPNCFNSCCLYYHYCFNLKQKVHFHSDVWLAIRFSFVSIIGIAYKFIRLCTWIFTWQWGR